jgi:GT2 family glycosyltransferase
MKRSSVDIVVPFFGSDPELRHLVARLRRLSRGHDDSLTVVNNGPVAQSATHTVDGVRVVVANERQSSYFARNAGVGAGRGEWIIFLDADVEPDSEIINRYFESEPSPDTGLLAGAIIDGPSRDGDGRGVAARYAVLRSAMAQDNTMGSGRWAYAQTANCAVRRAAFDQLGGFRDSARSGGDADLCFRLRAAGWGIERRYAAEVVHQSRTSVTRLLAQRARHGSGAAWLNRMHPGSFPPPRWSRLVVFTVRSLFVAGRELVAGRSDEALLAYMEPLSTWAFELGRCIPNEWDRQPRGLLVRGLERLLVG